MYFESLRRRVHSAVVMKQQSTAGHTPITDCIADCYLPIHDDIISGQHSIYHLPGGRGSAKSSFVSLEIVDGIMKDDDANAIVFRRYANTLRESVYSQISWAIDELGVSHLWCSSVSPMVFTYKPTGQKIYFRGLDDAGKLKSIKPRKGNFKYIWFEEFNELNGANQVRNVLQSVVRGGDDFRIFNTFNPPISINSWANKYIAQPDDRALTFRTTYKMVPESWLGEAFILEAERLQEINEKAYRHEYMGEAVGTGGEVFQNIIAREITDDEIAKMQYIYCGIDWGFSVDPFAFIRLSYDRRTETIYLLDEIVKRRLSNADAVALIKEKGYDKVVPENRHYSPMLGGYVDEKQLIICDSSEPKSILDMRAEGLKAIECKKYAGSVNYGIRWLQNRNIVIDAKRTPTAYKEFTEYEYETTKDGEILASVPDKNNHLIDGCRYALSRVIEDKHNSA